MSLEPTADKDAPYEPMSVTFDIRKWGEIRELRDALLDAIERREVLTLPAVSDALTTVYMNRATRVTPPVRGDQ